MTINKIQREAKKNFFFFMENDKANERSGHLMVSDYRRPRPRATCNTRGATGALPAFKVEIDALFEGTHVISTWKHCRG